MKSKVKTFRILGPAIKIVQTVLDFETTRKKKKSSRLTNHHTRLSVDRRRAYDQSPLRNLLLRDKTNDLFLLLLFIPDGSKWRDRVFVVVRGTANDVFFFFFCSKCKKRLIRFLDRRAKAIDLITTILLYHRRFRCRR